ncbi:hypothetical protein D3C75_915420 [compost metagenome]
MFESVTVGRTHVIHADGGDCLQAWIDFGRTNSEAPTTTDADDADTLTVDKWSSAEKIYGGTEVFCVDIWRDCLARCAFARAPEGQVQRQRDKALLGHFGGIQVRALLLHCPHGMADNDGGIFRFGVETLQGEQVTRHLHTVLILEGDLFNGHFLAFVEVVRAV